MVYWRSKLGNEYLKADIERCEQKTKTELDNLRKLPGNRRCADCGSEPTVWSSVNLGIFLCIRCGSIHRGIGTHISKPKGCTGTYLWGPDEVESMSSQGNERSNYTYGGSDDRPPADASDSVWRKYIIDKYEHRLFAPAPSCANDNDSSQGDGEKAQTQTIKAPGPCTMEQMMILQQPSHDADLLIFDDEKKGKVKSTSDDFFAQFGV
mmetsp:Transcript_6930/g.10169  ORF Transcript_6930/g.10169 Transcript_6930/m.10169 type:complete len:208 (+) Transcript_6930:127-750(+)